MFGWVYHCTVCWNGARPNSGFAGLYVAWSSLVDLVDSFVFADLFFFLLSLDHRLREMTCFFAPPSASSVEEEELAPEAHSSHQQQKRRTIHLCRSCLATVDCRIGKRERGRERERERERGREDQIQDINYGLWYVLTVALETFPKLPPVMDEHYYRYQGDDEACNSCSNTNDHTKHTMALSSP